MQVCGATFSKPYHDWLNKWIFDDMNQSEMVLEGQTSETNKPYMQTS